MSVVYDYFLDSNNYIIGWRQWNEKSRQDLIGVQSPLKEMNTILVDDLGRLYSEGYVFKLVEESIIKEAYEYTESPDKLIELEQRIAALEKDK